MREQQVCDGYSLHHFFFFILGEWDTRVEEFHFYDESTDLQSCPRVARVLMGTDNVTRGPETECLFEQ